MQPGTVLQSRYTVIDRLGAGSQAAVWQCRDTITDTPVAIKHASDPAEWPNARREYVLLRLLSLPGVVPILDEWVDANGWFVVMPLLDGEPFPAKAAWPRVQALMRSAASTLAAMHARGVVHADLKPDNMVVSGDTVTLIDLGFAMDRHAVTDRSGFTLDYAAPELWFGQAPTPSADVYALGRIAAQSLGADPEAMADLHASHRALLRAVQALAVPAEAASLLTRMLAWEPSDRPSAADVAAALGVDTSRSLTIRARHRFDYTAEDMTALLSSDSVTLDWLLDAGMGLVEGDAVYFTREEVSRLELALAPRSNAPDAPPLRAVDDGDVDTVLAWCDAAVARPELLRWSLPLARWCVGHTQATRSERHLDALALFTSLSVHSEQGAAMHDAALTVDRAHWSPVQAQCSDILRAAIAVRVLGRLDADSVSRVSESTPQHPALDPPMTLVKVWQMRSDMPTLRAWLEEQLRLEQDVWKKGRLLTWTAVVAYKESRYDDGLHAIAEKQVLECPFSLSDRTNESTLLLESGRCDLALERARALRLASIQARMTDVELSALATERSARYRQGVAVHADSGLVDDVSWAGHRFSALFALGEAAIAYRTGSSFAATLASRAEEGFRAGGEEGLSKLAGAVRVASLGDQEAAQELLGRMEREPSGPLAVQTLGLLKMAGAVVPSWLIRRAVRSPESSWENRREVLSIRECLDA